MRRALLFAGVLCTTIAIVPLAAQVPGRNVNMVSGGTFPGGDPFLQKQNEPAIAMSTRNTCHLLAGANDYRAVNLPGLPGDQEIGDAWLGWYESTDCGATWYSTLVPGYPQDQSPEGLASPMKGLSAGADPVVRSGAAGTFYYLFIAFNRGTNVGKLGLARAIDHNDRESFIDPDKLGIDPNGLNNRRRARSPIQYVGTTEIARGSAGVFIDKPTLTVFPAATGTCTIDGETVPATNVYVAWTEFVGNSPENLRSKVYFARSADCGRTLAGPATKLSEGHPIGQSTAIGVNPNNPNEIFVVWRQIRNSRVSDALLYARSTDGGRSFTKAEFVPGLGEGQFAPFDQNTTSTATGSSTTTFRTVAYPTLAFADDGYLYIAVSQVPGGPTGTLGGRQARITMLRTNGTMWTAPVDIVPTNANGQQFMPALAYAAGKLQLIWYDVRFDEAERHDDPLINEAAALLSPRRRRTIDLLGAQAALTTSSAWPPVFQPYGVAQPDYNEMIAGVRPLRGPRISQYLVGDPTPTVADGGARQLLFNRGNLLLYGGGTIPFLGDYIDVAPIPFVFNSQTGTWEFNGSENANNTALGTFQAAWTDNRDAGIGNATSTTMSDGTTRLDYTPPLVLPAGSTINDAECPVAGFDNTRTRDANVYTSRITQDFSLTVPVNNKRTNTPGVVRAFAVQLANGTDTPTTFTLSVTNPNASFSRQTFLGSYPTCAAASLAAVQIISVNVLPKSSVTRTVYVNCGTTAAQRVVVTATRTTDSASASVVINSDPSAPPSKNASGDPLGPESHNPDAENPDAENPDAENPDAENPDAENPDAENPDAENPDAENPDAENPDAENPDAENPDAENPDAENATLQDVSVDLTNDGDTTSGYQVTVQNSSASAGYSFLLLGNRVYDTPTSINCHLVSRRTNQQLFAIPNPDLSGTFFGENDPSAQNATLLVRPGESVRVVLRIVWNSATTQPFCSADPASPDYCFKKLSFKTRAQAPNTGETEPREDVLGGPADLLFEGTLSATPTVVGRNGFVDTPGVTIRNAGFDDASDFNWGAFLQDEEGEDVFITALGGTGGLAAGATMPTGPTRIALSRRDGSVAPGSYFVGLLVDGGNTVVESNEENNVILTGSEIEVVSYFTTFSVPESTPEDIPFDVTVGVFLPGIDGDIPVQGATVSLSLEGPGTSPDTPGPAGVMTPANPSDVTNSDGNVAFAGLTIAETGAAYRLIATVTIDGVLMKFQSFTFNVHAP